MNFFCQTFAYSKIMRTFATHLRNKSTGEMAEWSIAAVLKTVELRGSGGSNPSLSATESCKSQDLQDFVAEREGFEPPEPLSSTVFKTAAIDHSAISPVSFGDCVIV